MGERKYLRAAEIARLTGMHIRTVRRWIANKTLASTKLGGARLVAIADLDGLISPSRDTAQENFDHIEECEDESEL